MTLPTLNEAPKDRRLPPGLNASQRLFGAAVSLAIRQSRAAIKYGLTHGQVHLADALDATAAQGMKVKQLLMAIPGIGPKRAAAILAEAGLAANRSVRSLGPKQREKLLSLIR